MNSTCDSPTEASQQHQLFALLSKLHPQSVTVERRGETRYPYPHLIRITPVEEDGTTPSGDPFVVVGKHISESGLGFFHPDSLPYRYVQATLGDDPETAFTLLVDLSWCRFAQQGWYESGGRFLEAG